MCHSNSINLIRLPFIGNISTNLFTDAFSAVSFENIQFIGRGLMKISFRQLDISNKLPFFINRSTGVYVDQVYSLPLGSVSFLWSKDLLFLMSYSGLLRD